MMTIRTTNWRVAMLTLAVTLAFSPGLRAQEEEGEVTGEVILHGPEAPPFFGYDGPIGPEFWGELSENWTTCATGTAQTPIDLAGRLATLSRTGQGPVPDLDFEYEESEVSVINNGHTIQFNYDPGSMLLVDGEAFNLLQFHFHTPSEHSLEGGALFPLELHLVHRNASGTLAVVGVFIREGEELHGFEPERLAQTLPQIDGVEYHLESAVNAADLLPESRRVFHYVGSLTTPPCTEGVLWFVLRQPLQMSAEQLGVIRRSLNALRFASRGGSNARPVQPLNGRRLYLEFP